MNMQLIEDALANQLGNKPYGQAKRDYYLEVLTEVVKYFERTENEFPRDDSAEMVAFKVRTTPVSGTNIWTIHFRESNGGIGIREVDEETLFSQRK